MKKEKKEKIIQELKMVGLGLVIFSVMAIVTPGFAKSPDNRPPDNRPPVKGNTDVTARSDATAIAGAAAGAISGSHSEGGEGGQGGDASATVSGVVTSGGDAQAQVGNVTGGTATAANEGVTTEVAVDAGDTNFNSESNNTNVVLVPNNNTSGCQKVFGISFGNGEGAGGVGWPYRDKSCDFEQAADDAAASGEHEIAWFWRCHKPNLYKQFRDRGEKKEQAIGQCHRKMLAMFVPAGEPAANFNEPQSAMAAAPAEEYVFVTAEEFDPETLVAELTDEQYRQLKLEIEENEEDHELVEQRQAQQQTIIETQAQQIERLRREAEELRRAEEARQAAEAAVKAKFAERLARKESK